MNPLLSSPLQYKPFSAITAVFDYIVPIFSLILQQQKGGTTQITRGTASLETIRNPCQGSTVLLESTPNPCRGSTGLVSLEQQILNPNQGVEAQNHSKVTPKMEKKRENRKVTPKVRKRKKNNPALAEKVITPRDCLKMNPKEKKEKKKNNLSWNLNNAVTPNNAYTTTPSDVAAAVTIASTTVNSNNT